jgi:hypothetical protein
MELDERSKPRKLGKHDTDKLKKKLESVMEEAAIDDNPLPIGVMQTIAFQYCEVSPKDISSDKLLQNVQHEDTTKDNATA